MGESDKLFQNTLTEKVVAYKHIFFEIWNDLVNDSDSVLCEK